MEHCRGRTGHGETGQLGPQRTLGCAFTETWVQVESDLVKDIGWNQLALVVDEPDLNVPRALGEALDFRWLVTIEREGSC